MKKISLLLLCAVIMVFVSNDLGLAKSKAKPTYKWAIGQPFAEGSYYDAVETFVSKVEKYSNERIKIKHFPSDLLGDHVHQQEAVARGTQELLFAWPSSTIDRRFDAIWTPYMFFTEEDGMAAFGPNGWFKKGLEPLFKENGYKLLTFLYEQFTTTITMDPIKPFTPEHIEKMNFRMRVPLIKTMKSGMDALGFRTVTIPLAEVQPALKQGMVDGVSANNYIQAWGFRDMVKYQYLTNDTNCNIAFLMNLKLWDSLSKEDQQIIVRATNEVVNEYGKRFKSDEYLIKTEKAGVKTVKLTPSELRSCAKRVREVAWPYLEKEVLGKEIMDFIRANASPIPGD